MLSAMQELPAATQPLLAYVLLNFCLLSVEIGYGLLAGSLGLICDGVHLGINCVGIALSLVALAVSKQPPSLNSCYGYERVHVLAGFTNAVFLVFVSLFLVVEALHKITQESHHHNHDNHVITIASAGLLVNLAGLGLLSISARRTRDAALLPNSGGLTTSVPGGLPRFGSKRYSSTSSQASVSSLPTGASNESVRYAQLLNLQGVLLHATCDVLISIGVIFSSFLVKYQGWHLADPIFAVLVSLLIFWSVTPLLLTSGHTLLQVAPPACRLQLDKAMREISTLVGVLECHREHMFTYSPNVQVATMHIRVRASCRESELIPRVQNILGSVARHVTFQITKDHQL